MLRMKRVKALLVDKVHPTVVLRWNKSFLDDKVNGTTTEKLKFVIRKPTVLTVRCRITTIDSVSLNDNDRWHPCKLRGHDTKRLPVKECW